MEISRVPKANSFAAILRASLLSGPRRQEALPGTLPPNSFVDRIFWAAASCRSNETPGKTPVQAALWREVSAVNVLIAEWTRARSRAEEDAILCAYWEVFDGFLLPPEIARYFSDQVDLGDGATATLLEGVFTRGRGAVDPLRLQRWYREESAGWPLKARRLGVAPSLASAVAEAIDYVYLQQANSCDIRRATALAGRMEPIATLLHRLETAEDLLSLQLAREIILGPVD
jgi:hypothetical protein